MSVRARRSDTRSFDVWPVFGDTMLAFLLVLMLLLVFQVATNIRIVTGNTLRQQMIDDQRKVERLVAAVRGRHHGAISISETDGNSQEITLGSEALFESGSDELSSSGRVLLSDLVQEIVSARIVSLKEITVKGHTDDVAIRNLRFASNWELSTARSSRIVRFLTAEGEARQGIDPRKVTLVAAGYGQFHPVEPGNRNRNRRIEIRLVYTNRVAD